MLTGAGEYSVWATYFEVRQRIRDKLCGIAARSKCPGSQRLTFVRHPPLQKPSRLLRAALWRREESTLAAWLPGRACVGALVPLWCLPQSRRVALYCSCLSTL